MLYLNQDSAPRTPAGAILPFATLTFYRSGTTQLADVYDDSGLATPLANPVTADAAGTWAAIWLDPATTYRVVLSDANGVLQYDVDPYQPYNDNAFQYLDAQVTALAGGALVPGATLAFELDGDPADLWADAALSAALPNPVSANSAGVFPAIYLADDDEIYDVVGGNGYTVGPTYPPQAPAGPFSIQVGEFPPFGSPNTWGYNSVLGYGSVLSSEGDYALRYVYFRSDTQEVFLSLFGALLPQNLFDSVTLSNGIGTLNSADASGFSSLGSYAEWTWAPYATDPADWPTGSTRGVTFE